MFTTTRRRALLVAWALLALLVPVAACGGSDGEDAEGVASLGDDSGEAASSDEEDDDGGGGSSEERRAVDDPEFQDAMLEYAQCMRDHGVDMEDPEFDGDGGVMMRSQRPRGEGSASDEEFEAADEECRHIMEDVAPDIELSPEEQAERQDQLVAMAECMRERGHDMPDPQMDSEGRVRMRAGAGAAPRAPEEEDEIQADMEECSEEAGMDGGGMAVGGGGK